MEIPRSCSGFADIGEITRAKIFFCRRQMGTWFAGRVGMKRLAPLPGQVSSSPAPNRTCEFPRIRLSMRGREPRVALTVKRGRGLPPRTCRLPFGRTRPGWRSIRSVCEVPGPGIAGVWRQQIGRVSSRPSASRCAPQSSAWHRCGTTPLRTPCRVSAEPGFQAPVQPPVVLGGVLVLGARIGGETVWVIELLRIYEYCRDNPVGSGESRVHEAQMAIMQGTHHRDDGNFETFLTPCGNDAA